MNYVAEINAFERWLESHYLPASSQLLWYKMIALFNRCGWAEWVVVDNRRLMGLVQCSREATFIQWRNDLIDAGLIEYRKGKKGSPNQYKLLSLTFKNEVQTGVNNAVETVVNGVVNPVVQTVVQTVDINKLNETKRNQIDYADDGDDGVRTRDPYDLILETPEELAVSRILLEFLPCGLEKPNQRTLGEIEDMVFLPDYGVTPESRADLVVRAMNVVKDLNADKRHWGTVKGLIRKWQKDGERRNNSERNVANQRAPHAGSHDHYGGITL